MIAVPKPPKTLADYAKKAVEECPEIAEALLEYERTGRVPMIAELKKRKEAATVAKEASSRE
jgi:NTP pyrophosphatase (non-canonical NTP hydrolase)